MSDDYFQIIAAVCTEPLKAPPQKQAVALYPDILDHVLGIDHNVHSEKKGTETVPLHSRFFSSIFT